MILYAKSSLELIVNNRIGKVGIRPDGRPPPKPHHRRHHPVVHRPLYPPTIRRPSLRNASHLAPESARCRSAVRPSVSLSVRSVRPCRSTVRIYVRTYTYVPARHFRAEYKRIYVYASTYVDMYKCAAGTGTYGSTYLRIITYKRVILSYTPALLMIIKTPRSILFALEYFLKFSPGITAPSACPAPRHPRTALHHHLISLPSRTSSQTAEIFLDVELCVNKNRESAYRKDTLFVLFRLDNFVTKR